MLDILLYLSGAVVGWYLGAAYQLYMMKKTIRSVINDYHESEQSITNQTKVKVEEVNNVLYIYDGETDEFICQGNTIDEAAENFSKRRSIASASLTHNNTTICVIDGKITSTQSK